ncbi:hypothetical protein TD95_000694 [Thielaviopsis punctulata]|uniref:ubiquitinyl hydrolase 1 n=1 Tax=Thielaviopsis punctulata TaxID=72032 RepID=A0A0F4ZGL9_9PEZI|nr:hypothetical protein TD95_000694 [Thielaviopsis punctulata]
MNHRHLPAGQAVSGAAGGVGADMGQQSGLGAGAANGAGAASGSVSASTSGANNAPLVVSSNAANNGVNNNHVHNVHRRRGPNNGGYHNHHHNNHHQPHHPPYQQHHQQHHNPQHPQHHQHHPQHHQQHHQHMGGHFAPYAMYHQPAQYYQQQHMGAYPNPVMHPGVGYMPYQHQPQPYVRMQPGPNFAAMVGVNIPPSYPRHTPSPALASTYQPPPVPQSMPQPQTPSSVHASSFTGLTPPLSSTRDFTPGVPFMTESMANSIAPVVSSDAPVVVSSQQYSQLSAPASVVSSAAAPAVVSTPVPVSTSTPAVATVAPVSVPEAAPTAEAAIATASTSAPSDVSSQAPTPVPAQSESKFYAPLPWYSCNESDWPARAPRSKKRRRAPLQDGTELLRQYPAEPAPATEQPKPKDPEPVVVVPPVKIPAPETTPAAPPPTKSAVSKSAKPVIPIVPVLPKTASKDTTKDDKLSAVASTSAVASVDRSQNHRAPSESTTGETVLTPSSDNTSQADADEAAASATKSDDKSTVTPSTPAATATTATAPVPVSVPAPVPAKPSSWASLLKNPSKPADNASAAAASASGVSAATAGTATPNGTSGGLTKDKISTLADALRSYRVNSIEKVSFLEPRGLINGGNMCYMNSILQVLVHCIPFYDFLDQVNKKATHSFNSNTPLIDAMIMFIREFRVTASAPSIQKLHEIVRAKDRQFGDPFSPNFLYDEMKKSNRFAHMEQGHQQDAEEFLGLLLQVLDDECTKVLSSNLEPAQAKSEETPASGDDWMEVGPRQKAAVSRVTGHNSASPISRIFGGYVRCELLRPGMKPSLTTQFYQSLQLDIDVSHISTILDAMRHMARREVVDDVVKGETVRVTTQTLISELPSVLILHLKRFQFDAEGGTVKLWKNVGYPLELDIPRECVSRQMLARLSSEGKPFPRYRLSAVVYHHGKNASVGHYTVDVRRQDGAEWIHIDDTKIDQVRAEDVASASVDELPKGAARREADGASGSAPANRFGLMDESGDMDDDEGWKQVTSPANGNKRWSSVANGTSSPATATVGSASGKTSSFKGKQSQQLLNDNKVAYILFYQRL